MDILLSGDDVTGVCNDVGLPRVLVTSSVDMYPLGKSPKSARGLAAGLYDCAKRSWFFYKWGGTPTVERSRLDIEYEALEARLMQDIFAPSKSEFRSS